VSFSRLFMNFVKHRVRCKRWQNKSEIVLKLVFSLFSLLEYCNNLLKKQSFHQIGGNDLPATLQKINFTMSFVSVEFLQAFFYKGQIWSPRRQVGNQFVPLLRYLKLHGKRDWSPNSFSGFIPKKRHDSFSIGYCSEYFLTK